MKKISLIIILAILATIGGATIARYRAPATPVVESPAATKDPSDQLDQSNVDTTPVTTTTPDSSTAQPVVTTTVSTTPVLPIPKPPVVKPSTTPVAHTTTPPPVTTPVPTPDTNPAPTTPTTVEPVATDSLPAGENLTGLSLTVPNGFRLEIIARNIGSARAMALDTRGNLWITRGFAGKITKIDISNGTVVSTRDVLSGLTIPHGIVFDPDNANIVYIAEETKISRADTSVSTLTLEKIADLPANGGHRTRTLTMGPDKRLYVSIGSSCNACNEQNPVRSTIYSLNRDGSDMREYANGLRNPVFSAWHPATHELWSIDMGRDNLGDNIPPDEINIIREGQNYGWPICYGQKIHDTAFDKNVYVRDPCADTTAPIVDLPAHVSPLGIAFVPHTWPQAYWDDLLVAEHGSSSRNPPVGYKIVRVKLDSQGRPSGTEDFITGWAHGSRPQDAYGRPVGILIASDGTTYISDDSKGNIYRLSIIR